MANLLPDDNPLAEDSAREAGNPTLRIFGWALLISAGATFVLGFFAVTMQNNPATAMVVPLLLLTVLGIPAFCLIAAIVYYLRDQRAHALGFLLAALATPIVGFGSCLASLIVWG